MKRDDESAPIPLGRAVATVFLPFAGGYYLSYLYRSVNAVISDRLAADLDLDPASLGLLTSAYFLAFAAFQIPLGLLLDRYGPRRVQAMLLCAAALGAAVFSLGQGSTTLIAGRALIGLGVSGGLMASFKAITLWFPRARWPLVNGCFLAMGGLGAMSATTPVEALLGVTDWRGLFAGLAAVTLVVAGIIFAAVPNMGQTGAKPALRDQIAGLVIIYRDRLFWRLAPISVATMASSMAIQGLWAGPWLRDVAGFDSDAVAAYLLMLALAMTVGFVATGLVADRLAARGIGLISIIGVGLTLFSLTLGAIVLGLAPTAPWPWILFGLLGNISALVYAHLSRHFPLSYAGRANTALNLLAFLGAFAAQYAIGLIIDRWPEVDGHYPQAAYATAFGSVLAVQFVALAWFYLAPDTRVSDAARSPAGGGSSSAP
jgi:MFS family permease